MIHPQDIANALGRSLPDVPTQAQWSIWISDARRAVARGLLTRGLGGLDSLDQDDLDEVTRDAVVPLARRPDDATQIDVAVDDARVSRRYPTSSGKVAITSAMWSILLPTAAPSGAFSVRPQFAADVYYP